MIPKINSEKKNEKGCPRAGEYHTEIALDAKTTEIEYLKEEVASLMENYTSLELKITLTSQQAEKANVRANEKVKANEGMKDTLLDHWLDGFAFVKRWFLQWILFLTWVAWFLLSQS